MFKITFDLNICTSMSDFGSGSFRQTKQLPKSSMVTFKQLRYITYALFMIYLMKKYFFYGTQLTSSFFFCGGGGESGENISLLLMTVPYALYIVIKRQAK